MFTKYLYCYLRSVLVDVNDNTKGFCFELSDRDFRDIAIISTNLAGLRQLCDNDDLIKDFSIENNFLKCDQVPRVQITANDLQEFNKIIEITPEQKTFVDFLSYGSENNFLLLSEDIIDSSVYTGNRFIKFEHIDISQTTMTVYGKITDNDEVFNIMLVKMQGFRLEIAKFYYAVNKQDTLPDWISENSSLVKEITINNIQYDIYTLEELPLYTTNVLLSGALINKAMTMRTKYKNVIGTLKELLSTLYVTQGYQIESKKMSWSGGSNSYKTDYGVYLKSSLGDLSHNSKVRCVEWYTELLNECDSDESIIQKINIDSKNELVRASMRMIHSIMTSADDITDIILNCNTLIEDLRKQLLRCDIFLYKMRVSSYFLGRRLAPLANPILAGSEESAYTIVDSKLFYGDGF